MSEIKNELEKIRIEHGGILFPKDVVDFAKDPDTALHSQFEWNDGAAAEKFRLWQARQVIRVNVITLKRDSIPINAYVSLKQDRYNQDGDGEFTGGYRSLLEVLSTPILRRTLLEEAMAEHDLWEKKYQMIVELAEIFAAAKTVKQRRELTPVPA